jgi:hypothetical protein
MKGVPMSEFEIGTIYENKRGSLFLAVTEKLLITYVKEKVRELRPYSNRNYFRSNVSVGELVESWDLSVSEFDHKVSKVYFPTPTPREPSHRTAQRNRLMWGDPIRVHKISGELR